MSAQPERTARGGGQMRLRGLLRKEFLQILRDPSSIAIAFLLPVVLLLIFGYGVSLDAEHVPIALVVEQPSTDTASFTGGFQQSRYFAPVFMHNLHEAEAALMQRRVDAIVHLRSDFARQLRQPGGAPVQVIVNGVDANTARLILGYVQGVWQRWLQQQALARGQTLNAPLQVDPRIWFNSELRSRNFLVPGLIAIIMTLIGALLDGAGDGAGMGTRHDGGVAGDAGDDGRSVARQSAALLRPRHGRNGVVGGDGCLALWRAAARVARACCLRPRHCSCWRRSGWDCSFPP